MKKEDYVKLSILVVMVLGIILIGNIIGNKRLNNAKYYSRTNKNNFAMYIENDNSDYEEYKSDKWPVGYTLNESMSVCTDLNGNKIDTSLSFDNGKVTVVSNKTIFCTLYFDKIRSLFEKLKSNSLVREYRGEGYYHDETDKDTDNPFFTRPIYYWYANNNNDANTIKESWNVVFAGSCWQMIRTTENGGVKLLYNGEPDIGEDENGNPTYDCSTNRSNNNAGIGERASVSFDESYYYGDSYTYDRSTQTFRLAAVDNNPVTMSSSSGSSLEGKYTCKLQTADGTCNTLYYIDEYISGSNAYAISLISVAKENILGISEFNPASNSPTYVGYMYGDIYTTISKNISTESTYNFSNSISYDNGSYTLDMSDENAISFVGNTNGDNGSKIGKAHYVCIDENNNLLAETTICQKVGYAYYLNFSTLYFISLSNGKYVSTDESNESVFKNNNNVLYSMLHKNVTSSTIKSKTDNWYKIKLMNYTSYIDNREIYCNDRSTKNEYGSWNLNANNMTTNLIFNHSNTGTAKNPIVTGNINCKYKEDAFNTYETSSGNGNLIYPIGLITSPEIYILNLYKTSDIFIYEGSAFWFLSPYDYTNSMATVNQYSSYYCSDNDWFCSNGWSSGGYYARYSITTNSKKFSIRPSIALTSDAVKFSQGNGSTVNPYVVEVGNNISINDSNYKTSKKKAVVGEIVKVTNNAYTIGSFKLNGQTIIGNSFTMPNEDVEITGVQVYKIIDSTNNENIIIPNSGIPGTNIKIKTNNGETSVGSFKLNGVTTNGNTFTMPSNDVTITDVVITSALDALKNNPDYRIVDYIIGTGTQWINTNYPLWKDSNWKIEFKFDVTQHYDYNNMMGFANVTNTDNEIWIDSSGKYTVRLPNTGRNELFKLSLNTPYTIIHDNTGSNLLNYVNGELVSSLNKASTSSNVVLGFGHRSGGNYLKGKIYYLKFWSNGELVRYMIPVVQNSTGTAGMYDIVNDIFYTNQGTGEFTVPE